jgi:hypothetical protein
MKGCEMRDAGYEIMERPCPCLRNAISRLESRIPHPESEVVWKND